ncbi:adenosylcobinamide amidohydrolase [Bacillus aquiflavi]|uniref:ATP-binding cassette domain-containing protein n=1 Tax=Bacillus aquiflavi TaxID=2672567 RepID=A0A6B3VZR2_9BACI|nr:adenosylcobinamide amidohydrolase [Bacillus aquiflavi]MBA4536856.1 adenosylcobinamide amidohydrolase [Bacillus aquiflavi]NEY81223.1 ATP-binding cassette domain-containing protein [Bacillus aquiflavi]
MLTIQHLTGGYSSASVLHDLSFHVEQGELFGVLGPNGSGKTTLLKMVSGILQPKQGTITVKGKPLTSYSPKEFAKLVAVLPQLTQDTFSYTVKETVSLGRYAHQSGWFQSWTKEDEAIVCEVMEQTGINKYEAHYLHQLSGGERQRVFLAQALAQQPEILLLDEPTNHLDLSYQKELLDLLKKWTRERGLTVISIFHDLNLAGLYCDRLLLLENGEKNIVHFPNEVLKEERIRAVYQTKVEKHPHPKVPRPQMILMPDKQKEDHEEIVIDERFLHKSEEIIQLMSPIPLRTISSGVIGSGAGWHSTFVNRHVDKNYDCRHHHEEMCQYLCTKKINPSETVAMMTAVFLEDVSYRFFEGDDFSVFVVVTAGVSNAVDVTRSKEHSSQAIPGTINMWIFINGHLSDEAFIQSIVTATETKVKVMQEQDIKDPLTGSQATGTSTDSILIAATQRGKMLQYAGSITPLGKLISQSIYHCLTEAVEKNRRRKQR